MADRTAARAVRVIRGERIDRQAMVTLDGEPLDMRLNVRRHDGSEPAWGYYGSGPAQLALATMLAAGAGEETAERHHQTFKHCCIARIRHTCWTLDLRDVRAWLESAVRSDCVFVETQRQDRSPDGVSDGAARRPSPTPPRFPRSNPSFNPLLRLALRRMRQEATAGDLEWQS